MKQKLFGLALIILGLAYLGWVAFLVLVAKGFAATVYGVIPLIAGWIVFNSACKEPKESPKEKEENPTEEIKTGFARIRSFLKGLL